MSRRLDIGIASYKNPNKLKTTLESIEKFSVTDWRCFVIHNTSESDEDLRAKEIILNASKFNGRFIPIINDKNLGYAGAVNILFREAKTEYIAYCDNDINIYTHAWDEKLCKLLDIYHEIGMIFPNGGAYPIKRNSYCEIMWGIGYCWIINRLAMIETGCFDEDLGHQEEADYCLRLRMKGWKCAADNEVNVRHDATASNDPKSIERINRGVVNWVDKWCKYFAGNKINYYSPNVIRWEDWPPNALYLEEYFLMKLPDLNKDPEEREIGNVEYDLIKVPRLRHFYRGRII